MIRPRLWALALLPACLAACSPQQIGGFLLNSAAASLGLPTLPEGATATGEGPKAWGATSLDAPPPASSPAGAFLTALNQARRQAGLQGCAWNQALALGAAKHLAYLEANRGSAAVAGEKALSEDPSLPGHSPEGVQAAQLGQIGPFLPAEALPAWLSGLHHRLPLLDPRLRSLGLAWAEQGGQKLTLVAFERPAEHAGGPYPVAYPAAQQRGVPTAFTPFAQPWPLPADAGVPVGYPITLQFPPDQEVVLDQAQLKDAQGQAVPCHVSHPGAPANALPQQATICLIPQAPLRPGSSYEAQIYATAQDGLMKPYRWRFHTAAAEAPASPTASAEAPSSPAALAEGEASR